MKIRSYLKQQKLIVDGAFGTYYAEKYQTQELPEAANITHPDRVKKIHDAYIQAGAHLLRTNTFSSNTVAMGCSWEQVKENILAGILIAKEAIEGREEDVCISGDIGPIPYEQGLRLEEVQEEYFKIADLFLEQGIQALTFETFPDMEVIESVIERIREKWGTDPFLMVQFCVNQFGYGTTGFHAKKLLSRAAQSPNVDAVGFNCGIGPGHMEQILKEIPLDFGKYLIALPNAGYPSRIRSRIIYANRPDYFASKMSDIANLGVDILGGCCGTNPRFIRLMTKSVCTTPENTGKTQKKCKGNIPQAGKRGFLYEKDGTLKTHKLIAVELAPPFDADDAKILDAAKMLRHSQVDVVTFPDSPSGRTRIDSVLMANKIQKETGLRVMPHICCRDKNAIAMRSLFLGARINGIEDFLIITGDPVPSINRVSVKSVFDFDAIRLMKIVQEMNEEAFFDKPMNYGGAINQGRRNLEVEIRRVKKKMEAGAQFFLTQPVFTVEAAERLHKIKKETGARILCGIMPLISRKNAMFMMNEIAGVEVTEEIVARYPVDATREEGEQIGVALAKEMIRVTEDFVDGYYFSFPFNRVYLLDQILSSETISNSK